MFAPRESDKIQINRYLTCSKNTSYNRYNRNGCGRKTDFNLHFLVQKGIVERTFQGNLVQQPNKKSSSRYLQQFIQDCY